MKRTHVVAVVLSFVAAGCATYDSKGRWVRTGSTRFDAQSVSTAPAIVYTLESDGTWAGMDGDRYERVGDDLRKVGAFSPTPSLIRPSGWVTIERRPDGLMYTPSYLGGAISDLRHRGRTAAPCRPGSSAVPRGPPGAERAVDQPPDPGLRAGRHPAGGGLLGGALRHPGEAGRRVRRAPGRCLPRAALPRTRGAEPPGRRAQRGLGESGAAAAALGLRGAGPLARGLAHVQVVPDRGRLENP